MQRQSIATRDESAQENAGVRDHNDAKKGPALGTSVLVNATEGEEELKAIETNGGTCSSAGEYKKYEEVRVEIESLEQIPINRTTVARYSPMKLAAVLAAFFVSYDAAMNEEFLDMNRCLSALFKEIHLSGTVLLKSKEEVLKKRLVDIADTLSAGAEKRKRESLSVLLEAFMECINDGNRHNSRSINAERCTVLYILPGMQCRHIIQPRQ